MPSAEPAARSWYPIRVGGTISSEWAMSSTATRRPASPMEPQTWKERVQVFRSDSLAETQARALERRLEKAEAAVRALTPPVGPGRVQFTTGWELERAVQAVLAEHEVEDLLEVAWTREETSRTRYVGRGRGGPGRAQEDGVEDPLSDHDRAAQARRRSSTERRGWGGGPR